MAVYPYKSKIRRHYANKRPGIDYTLWLSDGFDVTQALAEVEGESLEIGGPSFDGFYFLDGIYLSRKLVISNLSDTPFVNERYNKGARRHVSAHIDASNLPYADSTLGLVLVHHLSFATDEVPHSRASHESDKWGVAMCEMAEIMLGQRRPDEADVALRVQMLREAWRTLEPGGLLITDGSFGELQIMRQVGFIPKAVIADDMTIEEVVLQKPSKDPSPL